jgi:hypothetical protein
MKGTLPVDLERLKREFPELSDEDLAAYVTVTQRVLGDPATRAKTMREVMDAGRQAQQKALAGGTLSAEEKLLAGYLAALAKMQRSTVKRPQ